MATGEILALMNAEDASVAGAVQACLPRVALAVDRIIERLRAGGRIHYFGAGSSGLLATLDAAECSATFGVAWDLVQAHMPEKVPVGADGAVPFQLDGALEDRDDLARVQVERWVRPGDVVVGVSASGATPYTLGALCAADDIGATTIAVTCMPGSRMGLAVDVAIEVETGPEVVAGSTRLKAGTAQKMVLNMLTTVAFVRLGHVYKGRMVDVQATNEKLRQRAVAIVSELTEAPEARAESTLRAAGGSAKLAIVMLQCNLPADEARSRLEEAGGDLAAALERA